MFKFKVFLKIFIINQISVIAISLIILFFSGTLHNFSFNIAIAAIFSNCIGFTYYIIYSFFNYYFLRHVEVKMIRIILTILVVAVSFFSGAELAFRASSVFFPFTFIYFPQEFQGLLVSLNLILFLVSFFLFVIYKKIKNDIEFKIKENENLKNLQLKSELAALQSKINPHFLFNTLNTILDLVYTDPAKAEKVVINLSNLYRKILYSSEEVEAYTLKEEINLIKQYLEIEKIRLEERLDYLIYVDKGIENIKIPPLIIEPIVENSIIHGIAKKKEGGNITLKVEKIGEIIYIEISDTGIGFKNKDFKFGFGVKSVIERLSIIFKDDKILKFKDNPEGGVIATMIIPFEKTL